MGFEPHDLRVMSPTSYQTAPLRDIMVPEAGVEPVRERISRDFKSRASANSAIPAYNDLFPTSPLYYITSICESQYLFYDFSKKWKINIDIPAKIWYHILARSLIIYYAPNRNNMRNTHLIWAFPRQYHNLIVGTMIYYIAGLSLSRIPSLAAYKRAWRVFVGDAKHKFQKIRRLISATAECCELDSSSTSHFERPRIQ